MKKGLRLAGETSSSLQRRRRNGEPLKNGIGGSELAVFEQLSHAGLHEDPETFNRATLDFLLRQRS